MDEWVALLRGVNVGGITIRSAELAAEFTGLGLERVRTVLASGNVAFAAAGGRAELKATIEAALRERFGYEAWIVLVTREEMAAAIAAFPFDGEDQSRQPWVIFCSTGAVLRELAEAGAGLDPAVDPVAPGPGVVYWNPVKGTTLGTPFAKLLAKARFRATTTNRNLRTLRKILA